MMPRLALALAPLLTAACTDDLAAPPSRAPEASRAAVRDRGPRAETGELPRCVSIDSGAVQYGTSGHDELRDVVVAPDGTILVAGSDQGTLSAPGAGRWSRGIVLAYRHDLGAVHERAVLDTPGTDSIEALVADPETDRLWVAARTNGALADTVVHGDFDVVVGDLPAAGGIRPLYRGLDGTPEHPRRLSVGPGGRLAVAGDEARLALDGETWINPWLVTFATTETTVAPQVLTTRRRPAAEHYRGLAVSAEAVFIGGDVADGDEQGMFVAARGHYAALLWQRQLSTRGGDQLTAVHVLPDGDVLWAGSTTGELGGIHHGGRDLVVGRLDGETGDPLWTVQHGTEGDEHVTDMAIDADGRIYLVGELAAHGPDGARDDLDAFLLVLDDAGSPLLQEQWGGSGDDRPTAVTVDPCGAIVLVGSTTGQLAADAPRGGRDGFVIVTRLVR